VVGPTYDVAWLSSKEEGPSVHLAGDVCKANGEPHRDDGLLDNVDLPARKVAARHSQIAGTNLQPCKLSLELAERAFKLAGRDGKLTSQAGKLVG
jgi:hypothetical protein